MSWSQQQQVREAQTATTAASKLAATAFLLATWALFAHEKLPSLFAGSDDVATSKQSARFAQGLSFSFLATLGNTAASMLRKQLSGLGVSSAEQVGLATLAQGFVALIYCQQIGLSLATVVGDRAFVVPAVLSSTLNALTKTLETRAYATTDVSLCAPFLAFDPVFQFLLPALLAPFACASFGLLCDEARTVFPASHPAAVGCVAAGAFLLKQTASGTAAGTSAAASDDAKKKTRSQQRNMLWGLPLGSWFILGNCALYAVTSRLDKAAVLSAGSKTLYFTYGRLVMGTTAFASAKPTKRTLRKFLNPHAAVLLLSVCAAEAFYLLALYQAFATIPPVYVTAIKRGAGLLLSALASALFFNDPLTGRLFPILAIVSGVVVLCL